MQKAEDFVGKDEEKNDVYFVKVDEERYHLDLASIYLNAPVEVAWYPRDARRELRNAFATRKNNTSKRRQAFETVLVTKSYLLEKEYEEATKKAFEALIQVKEINVKVYLDLIVLFAIN